MQLKWTPCPNPLLTFELSLRTCQEGALTLLDSMQQLLGLTGLQPLMFKGFSFIVIAMMPTACCMQTVVLYEGGPQGQRPQAPHIHYSHMTC